LQSLNELVHSIAGSTSEPSNEEIRGEQSANGARSACTDHFPGGAMNWRKGSDGMVDCR
jgi:hypothetical protein